MKLLKRIDKSLNRAASVTTLLSVVASALVFATHHPALGVAFGVPAAVGLVGTLVWGLRRRTVRALQIDPAAGRKQRKRNRPKLIREISKRQIDRGLKKSLGRMAAQIPLVLVSDPTLVQAEFRTDDSAADAEVPLLAAFRKANGRLLIAGAPGSGKTTLALELLSYLLDEAARDEDASIPVLFALGNWPGGQKPLEEWLQDEMKLQGGWGPSWVKAREIIPILDGLDEVTAERRPACLKAISLFRDHL